jgi:cytochrome c
VAAKLDWPGGRRSSAPPLTAEQKRFDAGAEIYKNICMGCHQEDSRGKENWARTSSTRLQRRRPVRGIRIRSAEKKGPSG